MYERYYGILSHILINVGIYGKLNTSTVKLAKALGSTQQTISRKLIEMGNLGLIKREVNVNGVSLQLDCKGLNILKNQYRIMKTGFETRVKSIKGEVRSGLGEGRYYVSLPGYMEQFKKRVGFKPFPGTLNFFVEDYERMMFFLQNLEEIFITGFKTKERTYGSIRTFKAKIDNLKAAVVIPERARHPKGIFEIIAQHNLRNKLKLKDNDKVVITC